MSESDSKPAEALFFGGMDFGERPSVTWYRALDHLGRAIDEDTDLDALLRRIEVKLFKGGQ